MAGDIRLPPKLERLIKRALKGLGIGITSYSRLQQLDGDHQAAADLRFLQAQPEALAGTVLKLLASSKSQFRQDLFALLTCNLKRNGYFVEFGATDGVEINNTWLLEKEFGWSGILAEPARVWHERLRRNRGCSIETRCVWRSSGAVLDFKEVSHPELSRLSDYAAGDEHEGARAYGRTYPVETISLEDMLREHGAPDVIDYLSVDTEGSEFEILAALDFKRYRFNAITCEHNFTPRRAQVCELLQAKGYVRKFENLSQSDDWFIPAD